MKKEEQEHQRQLNVRRALYTHRGQWWGGSGSSSSKMATPGKRVFFRSVFLTLHTPDTHENRPTIISTYTVNAPSISTTIFTMNTKKKQLSKYRRMRRTHLDDEEGPFQKSLMMRRAWSDDEASWYILTMESHQEICAPEKKPRLPGVAILDEEDPDPPHHCPRCDIGLQSCTCNNSTTHRKNKHQLKWESLKKYFRSGTGTAQG